jgi:ion channel
MAVFLGSLVALLIIVPLAAATAAGDFLVAALFTLVLVASALAAGVRKRDLVVASALALVTITAKWFDHFRPDLCPSAVHLIAGMALLAFVMTRLLRFILRAPRVDSEVICAGLSAYLLLGVLWMFAYILTAHIDPGSFTISAGPDVGRTLDSYSALYFSFITLCTVGYGDILPASHFARMLVTLEAISGTIFITVLISRLVGLYPARPGEHRGAAKDTSNQE